MRRKYFDLLKKAKRTVVRAYSEELHDMFPVLCDIVERFIAVLKRQAKKIYENRKYILETVATFLVFLASVAFALLTTKFVYECAAIVVIVFCLNKLFKLFKLSSKFFDTLDIAFEQKRELTHKEKEDVDYAYPINKVLVDFCHKLSIEERKKTYIAIKISFHLIIYGLVRLQSAFANKILSGVAGFLLARLHKFIKKFKHLRKIIAPKKMSRFASCIGIKRFKHDYPRVLFYKKPDPTLYEKMNFAHSWALKNTKLSSFCKGRTALDDLRNIPLDYRCLDCSITEDYYDFNKFQYLSKVLIDDMTLSTTHANVLFYDMNRFKPHFVSPRRAEAFYKQADFLNHLGKLYSDRCDTSGPFAPVHIDYYRDITPVDRARLIAAACFYYDNPVITDVDRNYGAHLLAEITSASSGETLFLLNRDVPTEALTAGLTGTRLRLHPQFQAHKMYSLVQCFDAMSAFILQTAQKKNTPCIPYEQSVYEDVALLNYIILRNKMIVHCSEIRPDPRTIHEIITSGFLQRNGKKIPARVASNTIIRDTRYMLRNPSAGLNPDILLQRRYTGRGMLRHSEHIFDNFRTRARR